MIRARFEKYPVSVKTSEHVITCRRALRIAMRIYRTKVREGGRIWVASDCVALWGNAFMKRYIETKCVPDFEKLLRSMARASLNCVAGTCGCVLLLTARFPAKYHVTLVYHTVMLTKPLSDTGIYTDASDQFCASSARVKLFARAFFFRDILENPLEDFIRLFSPFRSGLADAHM